MKITHKAPNSYQQKELRDIARDKKGRFERQKGSSDFRTVLLIIAIAMVYVTTMFVTNANVPENYVQSPITFEQK